MLCCAPGRPGDVRAQFITIVRSMVDLVARGGPFAGDGPLETTFMANPLARFLACLLLSSYLLGAAWSAPSSIQPTAPKAETTASVRVTVRIEGVEGRLLDNVRGYLSLYRERKDPRLTKAWLQRLHRKAVEEIRRALQPFGYYNVGVRSQLQQQEDGGWLASYRIDPGPQVKLVAVDVRLEGEGAKEAQLQQALKHFPLKQGSVLDHDLYEKAKTDLLQQAHDLGYLKARASEARILVDPAVDQARLKLVIDTGQRYLFGPLQVKQDFLDPQFVSRYLVDVHPGDPYVQGKLASLQGGLVDSGYFSLVDINPRLDQVKDRQVPVEVVLEPASRQTYTFGLGYDTDIGVNLNARWVHRRINRRGHKANASLRLSSKESYLRGTYWIPIRDPRTHKIGLSLALEAENTGTSERRTIDMEAGYYLLWHDWTAKLFSQLKHERFLAGSEGKRNSTLFSLGARAERVVFEEDSFPRHGWSLVADLRASPGLLSSTAYLRGWSQGRLLLPLGEEGRFRLRGELGFALVDDFDRYPNSLRFFAGGDNSVRGWNWKELGPKDAEGDVIGGKDVITFSLEYDHRVAEQWVAAGFVDGGNAFNDRLDKLYYGAGFGARWLSPVGAVRLDLAWPFHKDDGDTRIEDVHVHFGFEVTL